VISSISLLFLNQAEAQQKGQIKLIAWPVYWLGAQLGN